MKRLPIEVLSCDGEEIEIRLARLPRMPDGYGCEGWQRGRLVKISSTLTTDATRRTLFSELIHYCFGRAELDKVVSRPREEFIVHELDGWLFQLLDENPELRAFLWPHEKG